jgi:hypothetical protein
MTLFERYHAGTRLHIASRWHAARPARLELATFAFEADALSVQLGAREGGKKHDCTANRSNARSESGVSIEAAYSLQHADECVDIVGHLD